MRPPATLRRWLDRRHGDTSGPTVLRYRRVYILPTRQGVLFAAILVTMWLGAVNYGNSMAFLLTFLLAGVFVTAMNHTFRNLVGLRVIPLAAAPVFAGEAAAFPLRLENDRRRGRADIGAAAGERQVIVDIAAGERQRVTLSVPARYRGRLRPGRIALDTRYPAGLFRAWSWVTPDVTCLVYPRPEPDGPAPPGRSAESGQGARRGPGHEDFDGLRRYQRGDPVRRIAWKSANAREPQVKQFSGVESERLWLRWADTEDVAGIDARLSRLCRWVLECDRRGEHYGLALPGIELPPAQGEAHRRACLSALAEFGH